MKLALKLEELAMFVFTILLFIDMNVKWWVYLGLLIGPDISMLGYLGGNKLGAWMYNIFHHKAIALIVFFIGIYTHDKWLQIMGFVFFGHSSLDRFFGYGLKYENGFKFTHLGEIGKK